MVFRSLRWRLPFSYIGIVVCTTLLFGGLLLTSLRLYYSERERQYLVENGSLLGQQLADQLSRDAPISLVERQISVYANAVQVRIKLFDEEDHLLLESSPSSSSPQTGPEDILPDPLTPLPLDLSTPLPGTITDVDVQIKVIAFAPGQSGDAGRHSNQTVSIPLVEPGTGKVLGYLELSEGPAYGAQIISGLIDVGIWVGVSSILLAGVLGWNISRQLAKPLLELSAASGRMASGDLSVRVEIEQSDEVGMLASSFNRMAERVQNTVTTLRNFTADAAHQLYTPLTALLTDLDLTLETTRADMVSPLRDARSQTRKLIEMTDDLLDLSRLETQENTVLHPMDMADILRGVAEPYASRAEQAGLSLDLNISEARMMILGNQSQVCHAVQNLLDNAIKFANPDSAIHVTLQRNDMWCEIEVINSGVEILTEDLPKLFERFYRGRNTSSYKGSGLGLAIVKAVMDGHQGIVHARSDIQGTVFTLRWPIYAGEP